MHQKQQSASSIEWVMVVVHDERFDYIDDCLSQPGEYDIFASYAINLNETLFTSIVLE